MISCFQLCFEFAFNFNSCRYNSGLSIDNSPSLSVGGTSRRFLEQLQQAGSHAVRSYCTNVPVVSLGFGVSC